MNFHPRFRSTRPADMQIVSKIQGPSQRRRTNHAVLQETPLLAFLGLGLFFWIFSTNSLPAKRDLAQRLAQVEAHANPDGRLALLREELAREEALATAVREDPIVQRAILLQEHPTADSNRADVLMLPMSFEAFPDEPLLDSEFESTFDAEPDALPQPERAGSENDGVRVRLPQPPARTAEQPIVPRGNERPQPRSTTPLPRATSPAKNKKADPPIKARSTVPSNSPPKTRPKARGGNFEVPSFLRG